MSCLDCDEAQDKPESYFYRWSNANIELKGCKKHILEVMQALTDYINEKKKDLLYEAYEEGIK